MIDPDSILMQQLQEEAGEEWEEEEEQEALADTAMSSLEKLHHIAQAADSLKAEEIAALDLREHTIITDFFLVCTGKSSIQIRSIAERIEERLKEQGERKLRMEGYQEATWILMDYGDVVVHVMAAEQRAFYKLEEFWAAAPRIPLNLMPENSRQSEQSHESDPL